MGFVDEQGRRIKFYKTIGVNMSKEPTWAELRTEATRFAQSKQASNPLEVNLFFEYLNLIPGYVSSNEGTWANIIVGFEQYAKNGARTAAGDGFSKVTFDAYTTAIMPGSSVLGAVRKRSRGEWRPFEADDRRTPRVG